MYLRESYSRDIRIFDESYKWGWVALLISLLVLCSQAAGNYPAYMLNLIFINVIVAVGLNLLTGFTGLISLGHAAFMAVGAYSCVVLTTKLDMSFWLSLPASATIAGLIGFLVGLPSLRLTGIYLALATMAFEFIVDEVILQWSDITGGAGGLSASPPVLGGFPFDSYQRYFFITLICMVLVLYSTKNLLRGNFGRALMAVRDSETAAEVIGIHPAKYKTISFSLSALYTGMAGALYAHFILFISPDNFTLFHSIAFIVMVVVGGMGSISGSVMGAVFMTILPEAITFGKDYLPFALRNAAGLQAAVYGIILILFVIFEPRGFYGRWVKIRTWWRSFPL